MKSDYCTPVMKLGEMNVSGEHFPLYLCSLARLVDSSYALPLCEG